MLHFYYDKRRKRINKLQGVSNQEVIQPLDRTNASCPRKRKRSTKKKPLVHAKVDSVLPPLSSNADEHNDFQTSSIKQDNMDGTDKLDLQEQDDGRASSRLKTEPQRKFPWTENADR